MGDQLICVLSSEKMGEQPIPMVYHHHYLLLAIGGILHSQTHSTGKGDPTFDRKI